MSRGITETDVWKACDALLLEGARPTIERVRQKIGRGSPNTVSPSLDAWFKHLGGRIQDPGAFAVPPDLPDPVQQAAKHFWETALAQTRRDFDQRLQESLATARAEVDAATQRAAAAESASAQAAAQSQRLQRDLDERNARWEQEKLARATVEANLTDALHRIDDGRQRLERGAAELAELRESARRDVTVAQERSAATERRAALDIDAERMARSKADKRADALERKLDLVHADARDAQTRQTELAARLQAELTQRTDSAQRAMAREAELVAQVAELSQALGHLERDTHAARAQADLAERLVASLSPRAKRQRRRAPRPSPTGTP